MWQKVKAQTGTHSIMLIIVVSKTLWSCGLICHVLDRKVEGSNLAASKKYFPIQINKNIFAEVRAEEKGNTLTHRVSQSSSSRRRRGDKKRKKWRHHLKHQSYVVAPSDSICEILTSCCLEI